LIVFAYGSALFLFLNLLFGGDAAQQ